LFVLQKFMRHRIPGLSKIFEIPKIPPDLTHATAETRPPDLMPRFQPTTFREFSNYPMASKATNRFFFNRLRMALALPEARRLLANATNGCNGSSQAGKIIGRLGRLLPVHECFNRRRLGIL
jgi:hypothetical protein